VREEIEHLLILIVLIVLLQLSSHTNIHTDTYTHKQTHTHTHTQTHTRRKTVGDCCTGFVRTSVPEEYLKRVRCVYNATHASNALQMILPDTLDTPHTTGCIRAMLRSVLCFYCACVCLRGLCAHQYQKSIVSASSAYTTLHRC
jgi:hypothetical protein